MRIVFLARLLFNLPQLQPTVGVAALMRSTKLYEKTRLECDDLGYTIGPRLNAAGRLGQAELAIELLTTEDQGRANTIAQYMEEAEPDRQSLERSMALAALEAGP